MKMCEETRPQEILEIENKEALGGRRQRKAQRPAI